MYIVTKHSNMFKHVILILHFIIIQYTHGQTCPNNNYNPNQQTDTSSCMVWHDYSVKTFDDHGFNFKSSCSFTLTSFQVGTSSFRVDVGKSNQPCNTDDCYTYTQIFYGSEVYKLALDAQKNPIVSTPTGSYPVPTELNGISIYRRGNRIFVDFTVLGVSIKWDMKNMVEVTIDNNKNYKVLGLCGNKDKCSSNDLMLSTGVPITDLDRFLQEWQVDKSSCSGTTTTPPCDGSSSTNAEAACQILKDQQKFGQANEMLNPDLYIRACVWSYCSCRLSDPSLCMCETLDVYAKASVSAGVTRVSWRNDQTCPVRCTGELHLQSCAPTGGERACGDSGPSNKIEKCEEGCYCYQNNFLFNEKCYLKKNCPCVYRGQTLQPGQTVPIGCNTCTCTNGEVKCTDNPCVPGSCVGDPHYTTFDGKKFDFMGRCVYYLVRGPDFSIESDQYGYNNVQFLKNYTDGPSYARGVFIRMAGQFISLKPDLVTEVNNELITRFPHTAANIIISKPSDSLVSVYLPNNVQIEWTGVWSITVRLPYSMEGKVMGLLGTFSDDQTDDFMTPDGEIVDDPTVFGNSWKTEYSCRNEPVTPIQHPCDANPGARAAAEQACSIIKSEIFKNCEATDAETDYQNCVYDACYYEEDMAKSYCESIASFSDECGRRGIAVNWRENVPECKISCPAGLEYQTCTDGCSRTCEDMSLRPTCPAVCVEGCSCPTGKTQNEDGKCIPIEECKCRIGDVIFPPGFKYLESEEELLICKDARWIVTVPDEDELTEIPYLDELNKKCTSVSNSVYTPCKYETPKTCQNMHNYEITSIDNCTEGCQCVKGYVLNTKTNHCVKPEDCPCYNNGQSYPENSVAAIDSCPKCTCRKGSWDCSKTCCFKENEVKPVGCKVCTCTNGLWKCDDKNCPVKECEKENEIKIEENGKCICQRGKWLCVNAQCDVWGDSHIRTFDGVHYNFQGVCSYALTQAKLNDYQFNVVFANELCSHAGDTCLKSVTINTHVKDVPENITLVKNDDLPDTKNKKSLLLTDYSSFVVVDFIGAGVRVFWDKKTWVFVQLSKEWKNKMVGLCGNYNGSKADDLVVSGRPVNPNDAYRYVNLWKTAANCKTGRKLKTCNTKRTKWAEEQCNILQRGVFAKCSAKVPVANYYQACVADACKCETAGDCQPLCAAISVYAQQCSNYGVPVNWRTAKLCPIQCSHCTHYKSCVKFCPLNTCDLIERNITVNCNEATCVDGCSPHCLHKGYVYTDSTYEKSVPEDACAGPKCIVDGHRFYDQDIISKTQCKLRYCSLGNEFCLNLPTCPNDGNSKSTEDCGCKCKCS